MRIIYGKNGKIYDVVGHISIFCFSVSSHVYSGRPIDCINAKPETKLFAETICWASGTFTEPKEAQREIIRITLFGMRIQIFFYRISGNNGSNNVRQYQRYYQWIILILLVQAAIFSIPERLWKVWEHGRMQQLCNELSRFSNLPNIFVLIDLLRFRCRRSDSRRSSVQKGKRSNRQLFENEKQSHSWIVRFPVCVL